jgi:hypothetical protein
MILHKLKELLRDKQATLSWHNRDYAAPSPPGIKRRVLSRLSASGGIWVETGTYKGDSTALLAKGGNTVYTVEPDLRLYERAKKRFEGMPNIHVLHGLSETRLPELLPTLKGKIGFWLDGHYSGGTTHQGPIDCPIRDELALIKKNKYLYTEGLTVLVDDVRCFNPSHPLYAHYPNKDYLIDWARENNMVWDIEHDIFIAQA